jgi:hypothetical protein
MDEIKAPKRLKLYKALKIAYMRKNPKRQAKLLKKYGFQLDTELSDPRQTLVAYNPFDKRVLFIANGTDVRSEKDIQTDVILASGGLKQSKRFEETKSALTKAKAKYKDSNFVLAGHSLGAGLVNYAGSGSDKIVTYNPAYTPGMKARSNVKNYRTVGDVVSAYSPKETTTTLTKPPPPSDVGQSNPDTVLYSALKRGAMMGTKTVLEGYGVPSIPAGLASGALITAAESLAKKADILKPHDLSNIKNVPIYL